MSNVNNIISDSNSEDYFDLVFSIIKKKRKKRNPMEQIIIKTEFIINEFIQDCYQDGYYFDTDKYNNKNLHYDYIEESLRQDLFNTGRAFEIAVKMIQEFTDKEYLLILIDVCTIYRNKYNIFIPLEECLEKQLIYAKYLYLISSSTNIEWEPQN